MSEQLLQKIAMLSQDYHWYCITLINTQNIAYNS